MNTLKTAILLLLIILFFAVTACGSSEDETGDAPTLVPVASIPEGEVDEDENALSVVEDALEDNDEPAVVEDNEPTAEETPPAEAGMEAPVLALNAENNYGVPDGINTYRTSVFFESVETAADGTQTTSTITIEGAQDVAANQSTFTATAAGGADFGTGQTFTFTEIEGVTYFILPDGTCATFSGESPNDDLFGLFFNDGGFIGELNATDLGIPPTAEVNGVDTYHYVFDETNLNPNDNDTPDITTVSGDVYIARDGGYIVRTMMVGVGQNNLLNNSAAESAITYEINYFDFNMPVEITIPEACQEVAESEYPVLDDAYAVNALPGVYSYMSNVDVATAVSFYETEMTNDGWTLTSEFETEQGGFYTYSKDGVDVQIAISQEGEGVSVGILSTP
jgi:hypothetical protein